MRLRSIALSMLAVLSFSAVGQEAKTPWEEYDKLIKARSGVGTLGPDLMGDSVSHYNGALSFTHADVSIPGNSALSVSVSRTYSVTNRKGGQHDAPFADWELDLPRISGVYAASVGWLSGNYDTPQQRCSITTPGGALPPTVSVATFFFNGHEYWAGNTLTIPGRGSEELLLVRAGVPAPSAGGPYFWTTSQRTYLSCIPAIQNGSGEGFVAIAADGTKYWFDWMASNFETELEKSRQISGGGPVLEAKLPRRRISLYATRVEDRHGNWVTYSYSNAPNNPVRLSSIQSSDGRQIALTHDSLGQVTHVTQGGRSWEYHYADLGGANKRTLTVVIQPDNSRWTIDFSGLAATALRYYKGAPGEPWRNCTNPGDTVPTYKTGRITHPSGAVGAFSVDVERFQRSGVPVICDDGGTPSNVNDDVAYYPTAYDSFALKKKQLSGPGIPTQEWNYSYGDKTVVVGPDNTYRAFTFGRTFGNNESLLLKEEIGSSATNILRAVDHGYELATSGLPYIPQVGTTAQPRSDSYTAEFVRPTKQVVTTQESTSFVMSVNSYDSMARPSSVTRSSPFGSRTDVTQHHDNTSKWVLGNILQVTNIDTSPNVVLSRAEYDSLTGEPLRIYGPGTASVPGRRVQELSYNSDGSVATVKDGNNNVTTLSNWHRGIPRHIQFPPTPEAPAGATQSAAVNDSGWVTAVTDENGFVTDYGYDAMGRLASIVHPAGDSTAWNAETFTFTPVQHDEHGLAPGHWTMRRRLGNRHLNTYYDALWRPVLEESLDYSDIGGTLSQVVKRYDDDGRLIFQSYPKRGVDRLTESQGIHTIYDALGRATSVSQDSEHGLLVTMTEHLPGFQTRVTNPRGFQTVIQYQAFDQPTTEFPNGTTQFAGVNTSATEIHRDVFGKPIRIRKRNADGSQVVDRHYVYASDQSLCKSIEPETGATVYYNDAAGNLWWSASGLSLPSTSECNFAEAQGSGRVVNRSYDGRNRLHQLIFPDGRGNQTWSYTPDSLPLSITTNNANGGEQVVNGYGYNRRRMLTSETLTQPGLYGWSMSYAYNSNGAQSSITYPSGLVIDYAPNALGQPTKAGSYASSVSHYPNGAIKQFTYGNGIVHTMAQNARQLPSWSVDSAGVLQDQYTYDANGNVENIYNWNDISKHRYLQYDQLDRLTAAGSQVFGGDHWHRFTYDALDNLASWKLLGIKDHTYVYDTQNRLGNLKNPDGSTVVGFGYDPQGNLTNKNGKLYDFDFGNRLRVATNVESYRYDGHGRRVQATDPAQASIRSMYGQDGVLRRQEDERTGKNHEYVTLAGSVIARIATIVAPSVPALSTPGYSSNGSYTVSWSATPTATSYELQISANGGSWQGAYAGAQTSHAVGGQGSGSYAYRVRACQASTCSGWSNTGTTTVELPPGSAPSLSAPGLAAGGNYLVSWTSVVAASTYRLEESFNSGAWVQVQDIAAQSRSYSSRPAGNYQHRVRACNPAGCGPYSNIGATQVIYAPAAPTVSVPAASYNGSYTVSWSAVSSAVTYQLEEQVNGGGWTLVYNSVGTAHGLSGKPAAVYGYRVKACNDAGCGPLSAVGTIQVTLPPTAAPGISSPASVAVDNFTVNWNGVAAATGYELLERINGGGWNALYNGPAGSYPLTGKANATYGYLVRGCNVSGCGPWSAETSTVVNVPPPIPATPTGFTGEREVGEGRPIQYTYYVRWNASAGATYYELQVQYTSGGPQIINVGPALTYQNTGGGNRTYWLRACSSHGCSAWTAGVSL